MRKRRTISADRKGYASEIDVINDMKMFAKKMGTNSIAVRDYCKKNGAKYSYDIAKYRFGNWKTALKKAGLAVKAEYKKQISDAELISNLQTVANNVEDKFLTKRHYSKANGAKYDFSTILKRFGTWTKALEKSGLEKRIITNYWKYLSDAELIQDLRAVAKNMGKKSLTAKDYCKANGAKYAFSVLKLRFGTWNEILKKAGMLPNRVLCDKDRLLTPEMIAADMIRVAKILKAHKFTIQKYQKYGKFTLRSVQQNFGTWKKAKRKAGLKPLKYL
ncbi:MAG: hypothetical protein FWH36_04065 [Lentimicrobiaceae bacterium]|nr:hypothetical protein [Lentimicrobiaceae bacterium]